MTSLIGLPKVSYQPFVIQRLSSTVCLFSLALSDSALKQLVWNGRRDGGIELEVTRRDGSKCHEGSINQLVAGEDGELITIGKSILIFEFLPAAKHECR